MIRLAFSRQPADASRPLPITDEMPDWLLLASPGPATEAFGGPLCGLWGRDLGRVVPTVSRTPASIELLPTAIQIVPALSAAAATPPAGPALPESLAAALAMAHFGWPPDDYTRLAGASLAGHVLARGPLACGGGAGADWQTLSSPASIDRPIAELAEDGAFTIALRAGSGGEVSRPAVIEALLDGVGDPFAFDTPDCRISLAELDVRRIAAGRVEVRGALGSPPPSAFAALRLDRGWRATAMLVYSSPAALEKAYAADRLLRERVALLGLDVAEIHGEFLGAGHGAPNVVWRLAARCETEQAARELAAEVAEVVRIGPPGGTVPDGAGAPSVERVVCTGIHPVASGGLR